MTREKMWVEYDDGAHLSQSHKKPGDFSALARDDDTNELSQATLSHIDEDEADSSKERDTRVEALALAASLAVGVVLTKAAPSIKRWLDNTALPVARSAIMSTRNRFAGDAGEGSGSDAAELAVVVDAAQDGPSTDVDAASDGPPISMSPTEWQERFRLMLSVEAFRDELWKILATARVEDGDAVLVLQSEMEKLAPQQIADRTRSMLEANPSLLDEETSARLMELLGGLPVVDGQRLPVGFEQIEEAPRRTDGGT